MEGREMRRSMTLSDHISATAVDRSSHLRDLLKFREEEGGGGGRSGFHSVNRRSVTLGSAIASEKREAFASGSGAGCSSSRTLMDIIQEEHAISRGEFSLDGTSSTASGGNWQAFKDRIRLRRMADSSGNSGGRDEVVIGLPSRPVFGRSMTVDRNEFPVLRAGFHPVRGMYHVCCVCMVRHKGAAFIPCGQTFCRLCSRELWVSRGNCPLCNGYILEILDIF